MGSNPAGRTKPITCAEVKAERRHSAADQEAWRLAVQHTFQCRVPASIALVARSGFCTISGAVAWSNGVPKSADFGTQNTLSWSWNVLSLADTLGSDTCSPSQWRSDATVVPFI